MILLVSAITGGAYFLYKKCKKNEEEKDDLREGLIWMLNKIQSQEFIYICVYFFNNLF